MPEGEPATEASIAGRYRLIAADQEED